MRNADIEKKHLISYHNN